jgi:CxxC motif-containing protein (DUF1111 family)/mono/diheme cytochrome c family protein
MVTRTHSAAIVLASTMGLAALAGCSSGTVGTPTQGTTTEPNQATATSGTTAAPSSSSSGSGSGTTAAPASAGTTAAPASSSGTATASSTGTGSDVTSNQPVATGTPPSGSCGGALPATFTTLCSGCHTESGAANSRYPDLYQFRGTLTAFLTQVRTGGGLMAAYPATLISDADVTAAFTYFTTNTRAGAMVANLGGVVPLFTPSDVVNPPIVYTRTTDGVLITRGAGRVRGRHEKQGSFAPFLVNYMDNRTYGFIIEDWTVLGMQQIRLTYLPLKIPDHAGNRITNLRSWKEQGNNATFEANNYAVDITAAQIPPLTPLAGPTAPFAFQQQRTETSMTIPADRTMTVGQNYEFEIGVFILPTALVTPGSRDSYYTDTFRYQIGIGGLTPNNLDYAASPGPVPNARLGGDTTFSWILDNAGAINPATGLGGPGSEDYMYYDQFALNIQHENVQNFVQGRELFHTSFVTGAHFESGTGPFAVTQDDNPVMPAEVGKAGPLMQTAACINCHLNNGPGELLTAPLDATSSMAFKLPAGTLGGQLRPSQGSASVTSTTTSSVTLGDGTVVPLSRPVFTVTDKTGNPVPYSARLARKVIGMGLLEAIDETTLLVRSDPLDCNGDGISGRPSYVNDPATGALRIGRIGWKAEKISVEHQVADAANLDLDVGSTLIPNSQGKAGLTADEFMKITTYMRLVGVPPQLIATDPTVMAGEQIFKTTGCSNCHVTDVVTGANHPFSELRNQSIRPFTDLLLHDMGPDLADNSGVPLPDPKDAAAPPGASEWRTPPLWGVGKLAIINGHTNLLHDGRAASPLEAVLWHGGEASNVKANFIALSATDRAALLAFLASL